MFSSTIGRSDRYSHDFASDEEDGDYETLEQPFENFTTTTPRMSSYLGESLRLQIEEPCDSCGSSSSTDSKKDLETANRDSGIVDHEPVTILEPTPIRKILGEDDDDKETSEASLRCVCVCVCMCVCVGVCVGVCTCECVFVCVVMFHFSFLLAVLLQVKRRRKRKRKRVP